MANAFKHKPGCKCCNGGSISVTANGCGGGHVAIDFTLSKTGQTSQSGTTREDGVPVVISGLAVGNWTVSTTGSTPYGNRFIAQSNIFPTTVTAGTTTPETVLCGVASGYHCLTCSSVPCPYPLKTTLNATSAFFGDTTTLTYVSGTAWTGCKMRTVNVAGGGTGSVPFFYSFGDVAGICGAQALYPANAAGGGTSGCGAGVGFQLPQNVYHDPTTGAPTAVDCSTPQANWDKCTNASGGQTTAAGNIHGTMPAGYCDMPANIVITGMPDSLVPGALGSGGTDTLTVTE